MHAAQQRQLPGLRASTTGVQLVTPTPTPPIADASNVHEASSFKPTALRWRPPTAGSTPQARSLQR